MKKRLFQTLIATGALATLLATTPRAALAQEENEAVMALPTSRAELSTRLKDAGLSPAGVAAIVKVARDATVLDTQSADETTIPLGAAKLGGLPDLPAATAWPERPAYEGSAELKAEYDQDAAAFYADAGLLPPWMPEDAAKALVAERKKANDEAQADALRIMKESGADVSALDLQNAAKAKPEEIAAAAAERRALGEAVTTPFPLSFIAQVDLAAIAAQPGADKALPATGRLLFFYDLAALPPGYEPRSKVGWKLIYDETPAAGLERKPLPEAMKPLAAAATLRPTVITPRPVITTVPSGDSGFELAGPIGEDDVELYSEWLYSLGWPTEAAGGNHQLGGWPRAIQAGMQMTSQLASNGIDTGNSESLASEKAKTLLKDAKDWHLVLQIGADEGAAFPYSGALYVLMREEDLAARRFDKAWVVYEQD